MSVYLLLAGALAGGAACRTPDEWADAADAEAYALIQERRLELFGERDEFRIDPPPDSLRQQILRGDEVGIGDLSLIDCLLIAAENNRQYQREKEMVYSRALTVTLERWRLGVIASPTASADVDGTGSTGNTASTDANLGLSKILGTGATVVSNIGVGLVRVIGSGGGWDALGDVSLSITQPLLRGSGSLVVNEPLTQAERNLVYQVRTFERFRRTFAVDVANQYFAIMRSINRIDNEDANVESLREIRERNEAFARAGRLNEIEVDQARQREIDSINRLVIERTDYQNRIDDFKLFLGLPIECELGLDESELARLATTDLEEIDARASAIVDYALQNRLDYLTVLDQVGDAERQVYLAGQTLKPGLDLNLGATLESKSGEPFNYSLSDIEWRAGLILDMPVDMVPERNLYRGTLISFQVAVRAAEQFGDTIAVDLRGEVRGVQTTLESYEIQINAERLAVRRVESVALNQQAGRASTRDLLEAQTALLDARNSSTLALVTHYLAKLALYRDMEMLIVDEQGVHLDFTRFEAEFDTGA